MHIHDLRCARGRLANGVQDDCWRFHYLRLDRLCYDDLIFTRCVRRNVGIPIGRFARTALSAVAVVTVPAATPAFLAIAALRR